MREAEQGFLDQIGWKSLQLGAVIAGLIFPLITMKAVVGCHFFISQELSKHGRGGVGNQMEHEIGKQGLLASVDILRSASGA